MINVANGAGMAQGKDFSPLPKGTVLKGELQLKFDNLGGVVVKSQNPDSKSERLSARIIISDERYAGRFVFHDFYLKDSKGQDAEQSDFIGEMTAQFAAILEHSRSAHTVPDKYNIRNYTELNGLPVVVKLGQRKNKQTGEVFNTVDCFLSPNPASQCHDEYQAYMNGSASHQAGNF
ncbi:hypothetical protein [Photobacterium profundum]|uniref:Uncharacterized protein n=1 Tax=Photobacterium profundum (strain SS9) TaxID=298386 RepID=Q6LHC1_PHOPR|nr:hypothetical protein [Photobacterium profundum]CAG23309.1 hypothetical protein PBPRB1443 [Photobacterium profundum SS9]